MITFEEFIHEMYYGATLKFPTLSHDSSTYYTYEFGKVMVNTQKTKWESDFILYELYDMAKRNKYELESCGLSKRFV